MSSSRLVLASTDKSDLPNVILTMTDDQGWGDTGYNGHPILKTPHLDEMSASGIRFDRFYAASPVCSPTRGSCLTGRHPFRYGIDWALGAGQKPREGRLRRQERTLADLLKPSGFRTGHFGKWHLGLDRSDGELKPTPGQHGFETWFSSTGNVPTYNPSVIPPELQHQNLMYFRNNIRAAEPLLGDDAKIITDNALQFIQAAVRDKRRFLAVIWFHTPHWPIVASPEFLPLYRGLPPGQQTYYSSLSAADAQLGRLRQQLRQLGVADNTMHWFASDNGPEGKVAAGDFPGSAGSFRGRKRSLFEGGIRVPGMLIWPARIPKARTTNVACSTSDYYPTVMAATGASLADQPRPLDGINLMPLVEGRMRGRPRPIAFQTLGNRDLTLGSPRLAIIDQRFKLLSELDDSEDLLFDLDKDPGEKQNLASQKPEMVARLRTALADFRASCLKSFNGGDYQARRLRPGQYSASASTRPEGAIL